MYSRGKETASQDREIRRGAAAWMSVRLEISTGDKE
jgi:hypothetical protein